LLSNAPVGTHPDEESDGMIHKPDGTVVKPEVRFAEGGSVFEDPEPVKENEIPVMVNN